MELTSLNQKHIRLHIDQMIFQEIVHFSMQRIGSHFKHLSASLWDVLEFL
jgi:hypothetical protein